VADGRAGADRWWAGVLRVPETAMRAGGAFAASHLDHAGVVAVDGAAAPVVYGPADVIALLRAAAARAGREGLRRRAVVQYRAWHLNTASISVALRTGFRHYGDALVIRLAQ
jgi:hypothetical protein